MAQIDNLRPEDVDGLKNFIDVMTQSNPDVTIKTYPMDKKPVDVRELADKVDALSAKLDKIFGNAVLIDGRFIEIK